MLRKSAETSAREYAESLVDTVREPLIVLDHDLRVISASRSFYEVFKVEPGETVGRLICDLGNKQRDISRIPRPPEKPKVILRAIEDITGRKRRADDYYKLAAIVNTSIASRGTLTTSLRCQRIRRHNCCADQEGSSVVRGCRLAVERRSGSDAVARS